MTQRKTLGPDGLLKQFGLIDTTHLPVRARICVSCHLQIDRALVDVGHLPLEFELYAYNYYISKKQDVEFRIHWDTATRKPIHAKLWAAGQNAALAVAKAQIASRKAGGGSAEEAETLLKLYQTGVQIARNRFGDLASADYGPPNCAAAADLAASGQLARTKLHRRVLAYGVTALGTAVFDGLTQEVPDNFWEAHDAAVYGPVEGFIAALKQMAQIAGAAVKGE